MRKIELNEKKYERPIYLSLSGVEKWIIILEFQSLMTTQGVCVCVKLRQNVEIKSKHKWAIELENVPFELKAYIFVCIHIQVM